MKCLIYTQKIYLGFFTLTFIPSKKLICIPHFPHDFLHTSANQAYSVLSQNDKYREQSYSYVSTHVSSVGSSMKLFKLVVEHIYVYLAIIGKMVEGVPGHCISWQFLVSEDSPTQAEPPLEGSGELHSRILVCDPCPQVTLHSSYPSHSDHPPWTIPQRRQTYTELWLKNDYIRLDKSI